MVIEDIVQVQCELLSLLVAGGGGGGGGGGCDRCGTCTISAVLSGTFLQRPF